MSNTPANSDDMIDSRDVIARIEELEEERDSFEPSDAPELAGHILSWHTEYPEDAAELRALKALADEAEGYAPDWERGATLIRDSYFQEFAQQYADDIGALTCLSSWPYTCIDWERAARELQMEYTAVEFDGVTYWVRY